MTNQLKVKWKRQPIDSIWYDGKLHGWGHEATDYGSQSVAIIEAEDGGVELIQIGRQTLKIVREETIEHPNNY